MADTMADGRRDNVPPGGIQKLRSRLGSSNRFKSFWIGVTMVVYWVGLGINTSISCVFSSLLLLLFVASKVSIQLQSGPKFNRLSNKEMKSNVNSFFPTASRFVFFPKLEIDFWTLKFTKRLNHENCGE